MHFIYRKEISMGKGDRKKPAAPSPIFPTRDQIINAYQTYANRIPEEAEIQSHLGNPGGIAAVITMLQRDSIIIPDPIPLPIPEYPPVPLAPSSQPKLIAEHVNPIGMAYWRCINNHEGSNSLKVVLTLNNNIHIFTVNKATLAVINITNLGINDTGEQIYFSAINPSLLYIRTELSLDQFNIDTGERNPVMTPPAGMKLWQCHSSWDDKTHSASLQNEVYAILAWGVKSPYGFQKYDIIGEPDECQIDKSGLWLVAKEKINEDELNRIIRVSTDSEYQIHDKDGAVGHSDTGFGYVMGEDNQIGACVLWKLGAPDIGRRIIFGPNIWNMGYVSFCNAKPSSIENQKCLITTPDSLISVKLDGSESKLICPNLSQTNSNDPKYYEHRAKANLCPLGQFAIWSAYVDGSLNAYIVRIPFW